MDNATVVQAVIAIITILCSGFGAYTGVKVAVVRLESTQDSQDKRLTKAEHTIDRITEAGIVRPCEQHGTRMAKLEMETAKLEMEMRSVKAELHSLQGEVQPWRDRWAQIERQSDR